MTYYFGFEPSDQLNEMINEAKQIIAEDHDVKYYPYRNKLTQQVARELIDNLLVNLIDFIPNPERQASMCKIITTIEGATETMLAVLLGKDKNSDVLPSFEFLNQQSLFVDPQNQRRVGLALSDELAQQIIAGFETTEQDPIDRKQFQDSLQTMNHTVLQHFISDFTQTLKLGLIKRKSIPIARAAIDKGLDVAVHRLFPQLDDPALKRLANFYRPFIVEV